MVDYDNEIMVEISSAHFVHVAFLIRAEICRTEEDLWKVMWHMSEGGYVESDSFTGKISARNYVREINEKIARYNQDRE